MTPLLKHRDGILSVDNGAIQSSAVAETFLTADAASGSGTITVKNIAGIAVNQVLLIGELGTDSAEIVKTHASSAPSGTTVTLAANTARAHTTGEKVRVILYDQIEFKRGTTTTATDATALTVATTANFNPPSSLGSGLVAIDPTTVIQSHETSEHTSGYYFARYKNSITSDFSDYTDAVVFGGWSSNTVGYMIERALRDLDLTLSEKIQRKDCYAWLNDGMNEMKGKLKRLPEHFRDNTIIGQVTRGTNIVSMPSDIYDAETNKSVLGFRIGTGRNLRYLDPSDFDALLEGVSVTQVRTQASAAATSLAVDNSYDFEDSGTIHVFVSGTKYSLTYTAVTRDTVTGATAAFTGIPASGDGSITVTTPVDSYVWQGEAEGIPTHFTVRNGQFEFYPLADGSNDNKNVYADYNTEVTEVNSDGDTIDAQRFDILQPYLTWRMWAKAKNAGGLDQKNGFYLQYKERLNDAIRTMPASRTSRWMPRVNKMVKRGPPLADVQQIPVEDQ